MNEMVKSLNSVPYQIISSRLQGLLPVATVVWAERLDVISQD
jgi:hypothetical protein